MNISTMDSMSSNMSSMMSRRKDLPDDLACFLQQQKQRQARLETTMRSFPSTGDIEQDKIADQKKRRNTHEVNNVLSNTILCWTSDKPLTYVS